MCEKLGPYFKKEDIHFKITMLVQKRVAMSLHRFVRGDGLPNIGDLYGVHKSTLSNNKEVW